MTVLPHLIGIPARVFYLYACSYGISQSCGSFAGRIKLMVRNADRSNHQLMFSNINVILQALEDFFFFLINEAENARVFLVYLI